MPNDPLSGPLPDAPHVGPQPADGASQGVPSSAVQRFTALIEAVPDALVIVNADGIIVLVNRQTEQLFGYNRAELVNQPMEILLPQRYRRSHVERRDAFIQSSHPRPRGVGFELTGQHKDGQELPVEVSLSPMPTEGNIHIICSIRDTSARKAVGVERK